jgi:sugar lactone lactonase YvrE
MMVLAPQAAGATPTQFVALDASIGQLPESITTDSAGNLYLSMGTTIGRVTPAGVVSTFANIPVPAGSFVSGLKFGPDGNLYAGSAGFSPDPAVAFVWQISPNGADVDAYAALDPNGFPNDLAFDDAGDLYVTDPFLGLIWKIGADGVPDVWLADPLLEANYASPYLIVAPFGVDGIAFDRLKKNLYVGNLDRGTIVKIPVVNGEAGTPQVWVDDYALLGGVDGIAFDREGTLWCAVNGQDRLVSISQLGVKTVVAQGGVLDAPSSVVFGATPTSLTTLFIANFAINRVLGTQPGTPKPSVARLNVMRPGQPLL